jgi:plasmid stability protein
MTLTINLSDEEVKALAAKAHSQGVSAEQYARQVLEHDLKSSPMRAPIPEDFDPITIRGESLSATVLRERR